MSALHVFHNGFDWFVAESAEHAAKIGREQHGYSKDEGGDPGDWEQLPDDKSLPILDAEDWNGPKTTKTCAEWVAENGPGFLCSTEF